MPTWLRSLDAFVDEPVFVTFVKSLQVALGDSLLLWSTSLLETPVTDLLGGCVEVEMKCVVWNVWSLWCTEGRVSYLSLLARENNKQSYKHIALSEVTSN